MFLNIKENNAFFKSYVSYVLMFKPASFGRII